MKFLLSLAVLSVAALPCLADTPIGIARMETTDAPDRPLALSVWYPTEDVGPSDMIGGNAVFQGVDATPEGAPPKAALPLILVSHGGLRSAGDSGAWLAAGLAREGFITVEVNAPRPLDAAAAVNEIWQRPADLGRALNRLLDDPAWSGRIDPANLAVVGFALGGTAALSVAGAPLDVTGYNRICDTGDGPDCGWFAAQGVAPDMADQQQLATSRLDRRIGAAIAIDPEYAGLIAKADGAPTLLISLGAAPVSGAGAVSIPDADPFDGFPLCTEKGPAILAGDGANPALCGASAPARQGVHDRIVEQVVSFLRR